MTPIVAPRSCRIHAVGDGARPSPWRKGPRRLPFHLLVLSLDGPEDIVVDDVAQRIPARGVYLIPAGSTATIGAPAGNRPVFAHFDLVADGHAAARASWVWFEDPTCTHMPPVQPNPAGVLGADLGVRPPGAIERLFVRRMPWVVQRWRRGDPLALAEAENALEALLLAWAAVGRSQTVASDADRIARAEAVAMQQLDTSFGVAAFAAAAGLARSHFHDRYTHLRGEAPGDFLRRARIDAACGLLERGATVSEAANAAGFSDRTAFSRAFQRVNGVAPRAWRAAPRGLRSSPK